MPRSRNYQKNKRKEERDREYLEATTSYYNRPNGGKAYDLYQVLCEARDGMFYLHYDPAEGVSFRNKRVRVQTVSAASSSAKPEPHSSVKTTTTTSSSSTSSSSLLKPLPLSDNSSDYGVLNGSYISQSHNCSTTTSADKDDDNVRMGSAGTDRNPYINAEGKHWVFEGCDPDAVKQWFKKINTSIYNQAYTSIDDFYRDCYVNIKRLKGLCEYRRGLLINGLKSSLSCVLQDFTPPNNLTYSDAKIVRENAVRVYVTPSSFDNDILDIVTTAMNTTKKSTVVQSFMNLIDRGKRMGQQLLHVFKQDHEVKYIPQGPKTKVNDYSNTFANTKLDPVTKARLPRARAVPDDSPNVITTSDTSKLDSTQSKRDNIIKEGPMWKIGAYVDAKWKGDNNWYPGCISNHRYTIMNFPDKNEGSPGKRKRVVTYDIKFDDGDTEDNVEKHRIRSRCDPYVIGKATSSCVRQYTCPICHYRPSSKTKINQLKCLAVHQSLDLKTRRPPHRICDFETEAFKEQCPHCLKWFACAEHLSEHLAAPFPSSSMRGNYKKDWVRGKKPDIVSVEKNVTDEPQKSMDNENEHLSSEVIDEDKNELMIGNEEVNERNDFLGIGVNSEDENEITLNEKHIDLKNELKNSNDLGVVTCLPCEDEPVVQVREQSTNIADVDDAENDTVEEDQHDDVCDRCFKGGMLLCCDTCTLAYHTKCVGLTKLPDGDWSCPTCVIEFSRIDPYLKVRKGQLTNATLIPIAEPKVYDRKTSICNAIKENQCEICGWMSNNSIELVAHRKSSYRHEVSENVTDEFPYTCTDCNLCFRNDHHMKLHKVLVEKCIASEMRDKKRIKPVVDPASPQKVSELTKIQRKTMDVPVSSCVASNECPVCHAKFDDSKHRLYHQRLHRINHVVSGRKSSLFPYKCNYCDIYFQTKDDMNSHKSGNLQHSASTETLQERSQHSNTHDNKDNEIKEYLHPREVYLDTKQRCSHVSNMECPVCHVLLKGSWCHLRRHQQSRGHFQHHTETSVFKYRCNGCNMYFSSEEHLKLHVKGKGDNIAITESTIDENSIIPKNSKSASITTNLLNKVNELQLSIEGNDTVKKLFKEEAKHKDFERSTRHSALKSDESIRVGDKSTKQILDNLATKRNSSTTCNPGPDVKCPICHLVFKSGDGSSSWKSGTDIKNLHEHQKDKKNLHVMSNIKTTYFQWECLKCKRFVATKEQLYMHQRGGMQNVKDAIKNYARSDSKNKNADIEDYIKASADGFNNACIKGFQCLVCRKAFTGFNSRSKLHSHMTKSFGGKHMMSSKRSSKFKYKCEKCGNYASSLEHLNMHNNVLSEKTMDKEEIVILDYGNGTKRPRENPDEDIDIVAKKERKGNENRADAKKRRSSRFTNRKEKTLGAIIDTKEDERKQEGDEDEYQGGEVIEEERELEGESGGEEDTEVKEEDREIDEEDTEVKWERVQEASLIHKQQYARYLGLRFIDREEAILSQFQIFGLAKQTNSNELYFQYYDTNKYKNAPPRSMYNFEYTSCVEMTDPNTSWVEWINEVENVTNNGARKRDRKINGSSDDEMKSKKVK